MRWDDGASSDVQTCLRSFMTAHMEELARAGSFLDPAELQEMRAYYQRYMDHPLEWRESLHDAKGPAHEAEVVYAMERDLSLAEQCDLLRQSGFEVASHECFVGYHAHARDWVYRNLLRPVNRSMLLSARIGSRYVVVGRKEAAEQVSR